MLFWGCDKAPQGESEAMEHVFVSGDLFFIDACWVDCGDANGVSCFRSMFQIELDNGEHFSLSIIQFLVLDDLCCLNCHK